MRRTTFSELIRNGSLVIGDGYRAKNDELGGDGPIFLRAGKLTPSGFDWSSPERFKVELAERVSSKMGQAFDTVITTKGNSVGRMAYVPVDAPAFVYSPHLSFWRSGSEMELCPGFLRYWAQGPEFKEQLRAYAHGTDMAPYLSLVDQRRLVITLPPIDVQHSAATTLGAVDNKIDSNRRVISRAVQLVNAEFLARFALRPLETELGGLVEVVDCLHTAKPRQVELGPTLLQLNNIRDDGLIDTGQRFAISEQDYEVWSRKFETTTGDIVITNVGRIGAVGRIPENFVASLGRNMTGLRPRNLSGDGAFIAVALISPVVRHEIDQRTDSGTVMNALNVRSIPSLRLPRTASKERASFSAFASLVLRRADTALREIQSLASLRDALLPDLIVGARPEIRTGPGRTMQSDAGRQYSRERH